MLVNTSADVDLVPPEEGFEPELLTGLVDEPKEAGGLDGCVLLVAVSELEEILVGSADVGEIVCCVGEAVKVVVELTSESSGVELLPSSLIFQESAPNRVLKWRTHFEYTK